MKWISFGQACLASYYLRKFGLQNNETRFFDWIVTNISDTIFMVSIPIFRNFTKQKSTYAIVNWRAIIFGQNHSYRIF